MVRSPASARRSGSQPLEPADEMVRLVGERAHVLRAHVDEVARIVGAVGEARADPVAALDQIDPLARIAAPEQVDRGHDAAEAGADHGDPAAFACHCLFLPGRRFSRRRLTPRR